MGSLFQIQNLQEKRHSDVKNLAKRFNAEYCFALKNDKNYNYLNDHFNLSSIGNKFRDYFWGKMYDHEFCFCEYYYFASKRTLINNDGWRSFLSLRLKKTSPNFHLVPRALATNQSLENIYFFAFLAIVSGIVAFNLSKGPDMMLNMSNRFFGISFLLAILFVFCFLKHLYGYLRIKRSNNLGITNQDFIKDYVILSGWFSDSNSIKNVFTEDVCSKIVKYNVFVDIEVENNCILTKFDDDEQLSYNACHKILKTTIVHANLLGL